MLSLSILGYSKNMAAQWGRLTGTASAPSVDMKYSFRGNRKTTILSFKWIHTNKRQNDEYSIPFLPVDPSEPPTLDPNKWLCVTTRLFCLSVTSKHHADNRQDNKFAFFFFYPYVPTNNWITAHRKPQGCFSSSSFFGIGAQMHAPSELATLGALCCVIPRHILEGLFYCARPKAHLCKNNAVES